MARMSYQKGRVEQKPRRHGTVYVLRYRLRQGGRWVEKTEELKDRHGQPFAGRKSRRASKEIPKEVQKAADQRMVEINEINNSPRRSLTLAQFMAGLWQHHKSKLKASTAYHYDGMAKLYILPALGSKSLPEIDAEDITLFFAGLEKKGLSASYRLVIYQLLKNLFTLVAAYKKIQANPVNPKLHRPALERKEKPALTAEEIRRVIEAADEQYRPLFFCMALTGLRIGEMLGLRWQDVDFQSRKLTVTRTLWRNQLLAPKTKGSKRPIHLPAPLVEALTAHRSASRWNGPDDFVFAREDGSALNSDALRIKVLSRLSKGLKSIAAKAHMASICSDTRRPR